MGFGAESNVILNLMFLDMHCFFFLLIIRIGFLEGFMILSSMPALFRLCFWLVASTRSTDPLFLCRSTLLVFVWKLRCWVGVWELFGSCS